MTPRADSAVPEPWRARLVANCGALQSRGLPCPTPDTTRAARARVAWPDNRKREPTLLVCDDAGQWRPLEYVLDQAIADAGRQLQDAPVDGLVCVVCSGLGTLVEAARRHRPGARILAVEPDPGAAAAMLSMWDWSADIRAGRLTLLFGPEYAGVTEAWRLVPEGRRAVVLHDPRIVEALPAPSRDAIRVVQRVTTDARLNAEARRRFAGPYLVNCLRNLPRLVAHGDVGDLAGAARQRTAVLVGAGPSLNRNLDELAAVRDAVRGSVIISTDTALRLVLGAGFEPQLVVCVDPGAGSVDHLTNLPPHPHTHLVCDPGIDPDACAPFDGRTFFFRTDDHHPWPWLRSLGVDVPRLTVWGSVLTAATDLARLLGCPRLVYIGADLAYTLGQPYARGTAFEAQWRAAAADDTPVSSVWDTWMSARRPAVDIGGEETSSAPHLIAFRDWLVTFSTTHPSLTLVNATGAGILHGGRIVQSPVETAFAPRADDAWQVPEAPRQREVAQVRDALDLMLAGSADVRTPRATWEEVLGEGTLPVETLGRALHEALAALDVPEPSSRAGALDAITRQASDLADETDVVDVPLLDTLARRLHVALREPTASTLVADAVDRIAGLPLSPAARLELGARVVTPLVDFVRGTARAPSAQAPARRLGDRRVRVVYAVSYGSMGPESPMPTLVASLLAAHRRRQQVDAIGYVFGPADQAYLDTLASMGVAVSAFGSIPRHALAEAVHARLREDHADVLVMPQTSGLGAVLFAWRSAPVQMHLQTVAAPWRLPDVDVSVHADWLPKADVAGSATVALGWHTEWMRAHDLPPSGAAPLRAGHVFGLLGALHVSDAYLAAIAEVLRTNPTARFHAHGYGSAAVLRRRLDAAGVPLARVTVDRGNALSAGLAGLNTILEPFDDVRAAQGLTAQLAGRPIVHWHGHPVPSAGAGARDPELSAFDVASYTAIAARLANDRDAWTAASARARTQVQRSDTATDTAAEALEDLMTRRLRTA